MSRNVDFIYAQSLRLGYRRRAGTGITLPLAFCRLTKAYRARLIMLIITHNINDLALPVGRAMSSMTLPHFETGRLASAWHSSIAQDQAPCVSIQSEGREDQRQNELLEYIYSLLATRWFHSMFGCFDARALGLPKAGRHPI